MQTKEVADLVPVSVSTLRRWLKERRVREPRRDSKGWRRWDQKDVEACRKVLAKIHRHAA